MLTVEQHYWRTTYDSNTALALRASRDNEMISDIIHAFHSSLHVTDGLTYRSSPIYWWGWHRRRAAQRQGRRRTMDLTQQECGQGCSNTIMRCSSSYRRRCLYLPGTCRTRSRTYYSSTKDDSVPRWRSVVHQLHTKAQLPLTKQGVSYAFIFSSVTFYRRNYRNLRTSILWLGKFFYIYQ